MPVSDGDLARMHKDLESAADTVKSAKDILIISHIDADGITAGSIADITVERLGIPHTVRFEKKITEDVIKAVNESKEDVIWICDLGSGYLSQFDRPGIVITDHHAKDPNKRRKTCRKQTTLDLFGTSDIHHINPHEYGMDGSYETCGAGMTYLLSKTINRDNTDLAYLAVVGAIGDFQDSNESKLVSMNRIIMQDAIDRGDMKVETDLRLFGSDTRPLVQFLQYCNEPHIDGLSDSPRGCMEFLDRCKIPLKDGNRWRVWNDLDGNEKKRATDGILQRVKQQDIPKVYGEMYRFPKMDRSSGLGDAKEFATVLNSCGRYDDAETGLRICHGDPNALKDAEKNRSDHRKYISVALNYIKENHLLRERRFIQYFDAGSEIRETVVGIVAGMIMNSPEGSSRNLPMVAFVDSDDGVKVSARANRDLVDRGLDLSSVMRTASEIVGGFGGGHSVAAGATIPADQKERFLDIVEDLVSAQIE